MTWDSDVRPDRKSGIERNEAWYVAYYQGAYDQCRRLLTSVRMNKPQREIIEGEAYRLQDELKDRGVVFVERTEGR